MSEMIAFKELLSEATARPWKRDVCCIYAPGPEGANIAAASELRESTTVQYDRPRSSSPHLNEIFANAKLLTLAANHVEALVELVRIYAVTSCEACNQLEGAEICHHCKTAFALLASIEEAAKGMK